MPTEVIYADGSLSTFSGEGGAFHAGDLAIIRIRLIAARQALQTYIKWEGKMQVTRDGHYLAVVNVIEPLSGKQFSTATGRVTMKSCREALAECENLIAAIEQNTVVMETEETS